MVFRAAWKHGAGRFAAAGLPVALTKAYRFEISRWLTLLVNKPDPEQANPLVHIAAEDYERFLENAPTAVSRRGRGFVLREFKVGLDTIYIGAVPLIGVHLWDWALPELATFYCVAVWIGILRGVLLSFMHREVVDRPAHG